MATISTDTYLDDGTPRTAGETWTINSGATLTIRTDTRTHIGAPANNNGNIGSITYNEGRMVWDSTAVRVLPFASGSGNVPAIGTMITQGGVSGYLLGVWPNWGTYKTEVGAAMPSTGFLKFREVTGGTFGVGALTGIGASATDISVQGWIEIVMASFSTITVPRLGSHIVRGGRFYLGVTNGTVGQQFQFPCLGTSQVGPGAFVELAPNSDDQDDDYEIWPGIVGWNHIDVGGPLGGTDRRQNFLKSVSGGKLQMGEAWEASTTYDSVSSQASTYTDVSYVSAYTWVADKITVYYAPGHGVEAGEQVGLQFTSGGAVGNDGIFDATVLSPYHLSVALPGSGSAGNVTLRQTILVTFTNHTVGVNDTVYCDFTSGGGVDGTYTCKTVPGTTTYSLMAPRTSAIANGNVSVWHSVLVNLSAHGLSIGQQVYLDFTSGAGVDGIYTIRTTPSLNGFTVLFPYSSPVFLTGNVTVKRTIGNVAPAGCRVWIPSTILAEGAGLSNAAPNATLVNRPEWTTTACGSIDFEYLYATSGHFNFSYPYSVKFFKNLIFDKIVVADVATLLEIDYCGLGAATEPNTVIYFGLQILRTALLHLSNSKIAYNRVPGYSGQTLSIDGTPDGFIDNCDFAYLGYARGISAKVTAQIETSKIDVSNCRVLNGAFRSTCTGDRVTNLDYTDRLNGFTNALNPTKCLSMEGRDQIVDGVTFGFNGAIPNNYPIQRLLGYEASVGLVVKNVGTPASPIPYTTFIPNLYALNSFLYSDSPAERSTIKRCHLAGLRGAFEAGGTGSNSAQHNNSVRRLTVFTGAFPAHNQTQSNTDVRNQRNARTMYARSAVYGYHFSDGPIGDYYGRLVLAMNEPSLNTAAQFSVVSGNPKFNGAGGIQMPSVGDKAIFRDTIFRLGYTEFENLEPIMAGGTIGNYALQYRIDTGSGFSEWKDMTGANLSSETINPETGFKIEKSIETLTANATAITFLSLSLLTTPEAQQTLYPLSVCTVAIDNMVGGSEVKAEKVSDKTVLYVGTATTFETEYAGGVRVELRKASVSPYYIPWVTQITTVDGATVNITALQELDE